MDKSRTLKPKKIKSKKNYDMVSMPLLDMRWTSQSIYNKRTCILLIVYIRVSKMELLSTKQTVINSK